MNSDEPETADLVGSLEIQATAVPVSIIVPAFNEAAILEKNLDRIVSFMGAWQKETPWEIVVINDGSLDQTGLIADVYAREQKNVRVVHHHRNMGLGQALRTGFEHCRCDYVVVLDVDLSYGPEHIPLLLSKIEESGADIVASSPYMKGGKISNVPWLRKVLTVWSNRFLSAVAKGSLSSLTPMVRAYDRRFLQSLDLNSTGMDINLEIIYKAMILNGRIQETPSHLDWSLQRAEGAGRQSKMKILRHTLAVLVSGFLFRPVLFFVLPGLAFLVMSAYTNYWVVVRVLEQYGRLPPGPWSMDRFDSAVAAAFTLAPHTFTVGGVTLMIAIQLLGLGVLALQSTRYFEDVFHLGSTLLQGQRRGKNNMAAKPSDKGVEPELDGFSRGD
jgi:glycosyltransferase involved in cell wall biosynthesis